jgi:predicted DNA-binding protein
MGRPPSENPRSRLVHVRLSEEMGAALDEIRLSRLSRPDISSLVREAIEDLVVKERGKRK